MEYDQLGRRLNQVLRNIVYIVKFNYIRPDSKISRGLGASNFLPLKSTTSSNYEPQLKPDLLGTSTIETGQNIIQTNDETKDPLAESRPMYSNQSQGSSQMDSKIKSGIRPRKVRLEYSRGNPKYFASLMGSKSSWPRHSFVFISLLVLLASNCMLQIECSESDQSSFEAPAQNIEGVDLKAPETHTQSQSAGIDASKSDVQDEPKQVAESTKTKSQEADSTTQSSRSETSVNDTNLAKLAQSESLDEQQSPNTASNTQEQEQVQQQQIDETPVPTVSGLSQSGQELEQNEGWNTKSSGSNDVSSPQTQSEEVQLARQQLQPAEKTNRTKTGEIPSGGTPRSLKRAFGGYLGLFGRKRTPANKPSNENYQGRFFYPGSPTTTTTRVPYQASKTKSLKNADFPDDYREILIQPDYQPTYQQTEQQNNNQQQQQQQVEQVIEPQFVPGRQQTGEQSDIQTEQVANLEPGNSVPATPVTEAPTEQIKQETTQPIEQQQELTTEPTPQTTVAQLTSVPYIRLSNIATINSTSGYQNGNSSGNDANGEMKLMRIYVIDLDQKLVVGNGGGKPGEEYATPAIGQLYQAQTSTSAAPKIVENLDSSGQKYMILDRNAFKSAGNFSQLAAQVFAAQQQNYSSSGQTMYTPVLLYQAQTTEAPPEVPRNHQNSSNNYNLASTNEYGDSSSSSPGYNKQPSPQSSYGNQNQNQNQNHQQQQQPNSVPQYIPPQVNQQQSQLQYNGNNNDNWQTRHQQMPANHRAQSDSGYGHNSGTVGTGYSQNHADSIPQSQLNPASKAYNDNYHYQANETTNNIDRLRYSLVQGQTGTISYHAPPSPARPYELQQAHLAQSKPGSEYPMAELQQHQASPQDNLYYFAGQAASNTYQHQPVQAQESPLNLYGVGNGNSNKFSTHHQDQHQWKPVDYLAPGSNGAHSSPSAYDSSRPKLSIKSYHESPSGLGFQLQVDEQPQQKDSSSIYQNGDYSQPNNNNNANTMDKTTTDVEHALSLNTDSQHTRSTSQGHKQHSNSAYTNTNQLRPQLESQNLNLNQNDAPSQRGYQNQHYQQHQSDPVADQSDINLPSYNGTSQPNSSSSANFANYQSSSYSTSNEQSAYKQTNKQQPESQHSYGTRAQNSKQSGYASMEQNAPSKPQKSNQRQPNLSPSYQTTLATTSEVDQSYEAPKIPGPTSQRQPYRQQTSYSGDSSDSYLNQDNGELELDTIEPLLQHPRPAYKAPKQNKHHARRRPVPMEPQMVLHDSGIPDSNYPARPQSIPHLGLAAPPPQGLLSSSPSISYGPRPGHQGGRSFLSWETISSVASGAAKRLPNLFMQVVGGTGPNYHHHAPSDPHSMKSVHFIGDVSAFHRPYPIRHMATHGNAPVYHRTRPKTHPKHPIEESPVTQEYEAQMQTSSNTEALKAPVEQLSEAASAGKSNHSALVAGTDTPIEPIELTNVEVVPPKSPSKTAKYVESVVTSSELDPDQVAVLSAADNSKPERPKPRRPKKPRGRRVKRPKLPLNQQIMDSLPEAESDSELSEPQESPIGLVHPGQAPALMGAPMQDEQDIRGSGFRGKLVEGLSDPFRSVQIGQYKLTPQTQFVQSIIEPSRQMIGQYLKQYIGHWNQLTG